MLLPLTWLKHIANSLCSGKLRKAATVWFREKTWSVGSNLVTVANNGRATLWDCTEGICLMDVSLGLNIGACHCQLAGQLLACEVGSIDSESRKAAPRLALIDASCLMVDTEVCPVQIGVLLPNHNDGKAHKCFLDLSNLFAWSCLCIPYMRVTCTRAIRKQADSALSERHDYIEPCSWHPHPEHCFAVRALHICIFASFICSIMYYLYAPCFNPFLGASFSILTSPPCHLHCLISYHNPI